MDPPELREAHPWTRRLVNLTCRIPAASAAASIASTGGHPVCSLIDSSSPNAVKSTRKTSSFNANLFCSEATTAGAALKMMLA